MIHKRAQLLSRTALWLGGVFLVLSTASYNGRYGGVLLVEASLGSWKQWGGVRPSWITMSNTDKYSTDVHYTINPGLTTKLARTKAKGKYQLNRALQEVLEETPRGGQDPERVDALVRVVGTATQAVISCGRAVLPPTVAVVQTVVNFYRALPRDAIIAQIGLVYCFAGGYYPTLFSSLQAARHCGWEVMTEAIRDLTDEAINVIDATADIQWDQLQRREVFLRQTNIVLKTVDPLKINQAAAALYTTWLGVSAVLEKEYARVISLSLTISFYLERAARWILEPPVRAVVPKDYHKWVPVAIGWGCKAAAMNVAWRIQRVLTASASAMAGGVMFSRALLRMFHKRGISLFGWTPDETGQESPLDEILGFTVAAVGFWTQIEVQYKNNFSFEVPFPLSLITWPFDFLERWIQWAITK